MQEIPAPHELIRHQRFLRGLARSLVADEAQAEDLVQESLLAGLTNPPRSAESARAFLGAVLRNLAGNLRRGEARRSAREAEVARAPRAPSTHELQEQLELERAVVDAVLTLPDTQRRAVYMRWYEDLPPREIARRLGLPLETVRSHLKRGRARLRANLDKRYGERSAWLPLLATIGRRAAPTTGALPFALSFPVASLACAALIAALSLTPPADNPTAVTRSAQATTPPTASLRQSESAARVPATSRPPASAVASPPTSAPVRGQVGDASTGEPVPELEVVLIDARGKELRTRTDAVGCFDTAPASLALGALQVRLEDGPARHSVPLVESAREHQGQPLALHARIGPTFELELDGGHPEELHASLAWVVDSGLLSRAARVAVRPGARPWVRFPRMPQLSLTRNGGRSTLALRVESSDGLRAARRRVHARAGIQPQPLALTLAPSSAAHGTLLDSNGRPVPAAQLFLARADGHGPRVELFTDSLGAWSAAGLEAGAWCIEARAARHAPERTRFSLVATERTRVQLVLAALPTTLIEGNVTSRAGRVLPPITLHLRAVDEPERSFQLEAHPTDDDGSRVAFRAELPAGAWIVAPAAGRGQRFEPSERVVIAPAPPLTFELRDELPARPLFVRAFDAESGAPLDRTQVTFLPDPLERGGRRAAEHALPLAPRELPFGAQGVEALTDGLQLHWLVEAEGYRSAQGDRGALKPEGDAWALEVRLERSWQARLWIGWRDEHGAARPLSGARLETRAGRVLGESLDDGELWVELSYDPGRVQVVRDGWELIAREPSARALEPGAAALRRVWMQPAR